MRILLTLSLMLVGGLLTAGSLPGAALPATATSDWELKKDQDGVQVYVRSVSGQAFKESRAVVEFKGTPEAVRNLIFDYGDYTAWVPRVLNARLVERVSDQELISYSLNDSPWPVSDRDLVLRNTISSDAKGAITIRMSAIKGVVPEVKGVVRMVYFEGHYLLEPLEGGKVRVTYQAILDPAGSVPAWMANMAVVDTPFDLLVQMRRRLTAR
jgi:hypothetical protein